MTRVYLAARAGRRLELLGYAQALGAIGYTVTSRWLQREADETTMTPEQRAQLAQACLVDIHRSELVVAFTEASDSVYARGGRHVEFGYAAGLDRRLMVVGPQENAFCCLAGVEWYPTWCDAKVALVLSMWRTRAERVRSTEIHG